MDDCLPIAKRTGTHAPRYLPFKGASSAESYIRKAVSERGLTPGPAGLADAKAEIGIGGSREAPPYPDLCTGTCTWTRLCLLREVPQPSRLASTATACQSPRRNAASASKRRESASGRNA